MSNRQLKELRGVLDGGDSFMSGGHQIIKLRQPVRKTPDWALNNSDIQKLLLRAFPRLKTDERQGKSAGRWAVVIQLYFRALMSCRQTAEQTGLSYDSVETMIRRIRRLVNTPVKRHRGRPKK